MTALPSSKLGKRDTALCFIALETYSMCVEETVSGVGKFCMCGFEAYYRSFQKARTRECTKALVNIDTIHNRPATLFCGYDR